MVSFIEFMVANTIKKGGSACPPCAISMKKGLGLLLLIILPTLIISSTVLSQSWDEGLLAYWSFDEGKGNIVEDLSGNGNHGVIKGGVEWAKGKWGNALRFDGTSGHVEIPMNQSLKSPGSLSIEAWINPTPPHQKGFGGIMNNINGAANRRLLIREFDNVLYAQLHGPTDGSQTFFGPKVESNKWTHVVYVFTGEEEIWYLNGKEEKRSFYSEEMPIGDNPLCIGWGFTGPDHYHFRGMIDEVKIYERPLSKDHVIAKYETPPK